MLHGDAQECMAIEKAPDATLELSAPGCSPSESLSTTFGTSDTLIVGGGPERTFPMETYMDIAMI